MVSLLFPYSPIDYFAQKNGNGALNVLKTDG